MRSNEGNKENLQKRHLYPLLSCQESETKFGICCINPCIQSTFAMGTRQLLCCTLVHDTVHVMPDSFFTVYLPPLDQGQQAVGAGSLPDSSTLAMRVVERSIKLHKLFSASVRPWISGTVTFTTDAAPFWILCWYLLHSLLPLSLTARATCRYKSNCHLSLPLCIWMK